MSKVFVSRKGEVAIRVNDELKNLINEACDIMDFEGVDTGTDVYAIKRAKKFMLKNGMVYLSEILLAHKIVVEDMRKDITEHISDAYNYSNAGFEGGACCGPSYTESKCCDCEECDSCNDDVPSRTNTIWNKVEGFFRSNGTYVESHLRRTK